MKNETKYETAKYFFENKRAVHITLRNKRFHNGIILIVKNDFILFDDERLGEMPLFFLEIENIEPREPKEFGR